MSTPANSQTSRDGQRTYTFQGEDFPSVTSIMSVISKPGLVPGARKVQAEVILNQLGHYTDMVVNDGIQPARMQASRDAKKVWDQTSDLGSRVHAGVEQIVKYGKQNILAYDDVVPYLEQFLAWAEQYQPIYEASEITVYNRQYNYAGTIDLVASIYTDPFTREYVELDVKTGKDVWPDTALQLAAYRYGEFVGRDGQELPMPLIDKTAVLHLRPDSWQVVYMDTSWQVFEAFLAARRLWSWTFEQSKGVIL